MCRQKALKWLYILESIQTTLFKADYDLRWWQVLEKANSTFSSWRMTNRYVLCCFIHRSLLFFTEVLCFTIPRAQKSAQDCLTNATSRGINCQVFWMIQIEYTQVSFTLLPAWLRVESDILSRLVCFACNYTSSRVLHRVYPFAIHNQLI